MGEQAASIRAERFVIVVRYSADGVRGSIRRGGEKAVAFASWLELLGLLEGPGRAGTGTGRG